MKDSYIMISSIKLTALANQSLKRTNESFRAAQRRHAEIIQNEIVQRLNRERKSWWSFFFGYKDRSIPTIDYILESLSKRDGDDTKMLFIKLRYERHYDVAYRLLNAAAHADEVLVSTSDLSLLTSDSFE